MRSPVARTAPGAVARPGAPGAAASFSTVTELPGGGATPEQISMLYTRYHWAGERVAGKDVLEVACGPGVGLGYLARLAGRIVGGDYDEQLMCSAQARYRSRIPLLRLDAEALPFADAAFDVLVMFEALYYLARPEEFFREARRVLRAGGTLLVCLPNRDWVGFNPSPFAVRYFSPAELSDALSAAGFAPHLFGGFPAGSESLRDRILLTVRRAAVNMHVMPKTMKGKELVKRLLYRRLVPVPPEVHDGMAAVGDLAPIDAGAPAPAFRVLYAVGDRR